MNVFSEGGSSNPTTKEILLYLYNYSFSLVLFLVHIFIEFELFTVSL